ncbi:hypothetical protein JCM37172_04360 [Faecalimonas hominis]
MECQKEKSVWGIGMKIPTGKGKKHWNEKHGLNMEECYFKMTRKSWKWQKPSFLKLQEKYSGY